MQGDFGLNQRYSIDAMAGKWWSTRTAGGINQSNPATWAELIAKNPDATISAISIDNGGSSGNTIPADQFAAGVDNVIVGFGIDVHPLRLRRLVGRHTRAGARRPPESSCSKPAGVTVRSRPAGAPAGTDGRRGRH